MHSNTHKCSCRALEILGHSPVHVMSCQCHTLATCCGLKWVLSDCSLGPNPRGGFSGCAVAPHLPVSISFPLSVRDNYHGKHVMHFGFQRLLKTRNPRKPAIIRNLRTGNLCCISWKSHKFAQIHIAWKTQNVTILGLVGPLFLFPSCPLSLLTHLGPFSSDSHQPLPIYSTDPLMRTLVP